MGRGRLAVTVTTVFTLSEWNERLLAFVELLVDPAVVVGQGVKLLITSRVLFADVLRGFRLPGFRTDDVLTLRVVRLEHVLAGSRAGGGRGGGRGAGGCRREGGGLGGAPVSNEVHHHATTRASEVGDLVEVQFQFC